MEDERCFRLSLWPEDDRETKVRERYCAWLNAYNEPVCPDPAYPNDGYEWTIYSTSFSYPFQLSDQCRYAMIKISYHLNGGTGRQMGPQ